MPIRLAGKRRGGSDRSKGVKAGVNSSEVALFSLWFNLINFCLLGVGVTTNVEKAEDPNTGVADADKLGIGKADPKKADGAAADEAEANGAEADGANESGTDIANLVEANGVD